MKKLDGVAYDSTHCPLSQLSFNSLDNLNKYYNNTSQVTGGRWSP